MIIGLAHVCIGATDLGATKRFYTDVLGLEIGFVFERNGEEVGFYLRLPDGSFIEVFHQDRVAAERPLVHHFCLEVADISAAVLTIRQRGVDISDAHLGADHTWQAWTRDPSGVEIEIFQYTPESLQSTGGVCHLTG